ncbi:MAG: Bcr/CflA family multidrug efflux MFS transporter [Burkholderiales bacterium]|nr:Bcr/CflA family multidrug efflux MFS transporter [Burkholderiales bacterium]
MERSADSRQTVDSGIAPSSAAGIALTDRLLRFTLILGALTAFAPMSIDMYLPSLPTLGRDFATGTEQVQATLSAFFIGLALGQALYGPLSDRFGRRPPMFVGIAIYTVASVGCALATTIEWLVAMRFLQAMGGCAGVVIARAVVRDLFDARDSARMLSRLLLVMGLAPILAPLAGGFMLNVAGWRAIFWALSGFGALCFVGVIALPETRQASAAPLRFGAVLRRYGNLLAHRRFMGFTLSAGCAQAGMFAYISGSPFVFIELYGVPAHAYGWLFGLNALGLIAASQVNRRLLDRHEPQQLLTWSFRATAGFGLLLVVAAWTGVGGLIVLLLPLFGFVTSLGFVGPNATACAMAPFADQAGGASALLGTLQFGAAAVAGTLVGLLYDGTAVPMALVMATCGIAAWIVRGALVR